MCDLCQSQNNYVPAVCWCLDCNNTLCIDCSTNHSSKQVTKDHHLLGVRSKYDVQFDIERLDNCTEHSKFKMAYYCHVHDFPCCSACLKGNHKTCNEVTNLDIACKHVGKPVFQELCVEMNNINESIDNLEGEISTNISDINIDCQNIASQIAEVKSKVIEQINENEKLLLLEMQEETKKTITKKQEVTKQCEIISDKLIIRSNVMRFVKQHGTEKQGFILSHILQQELEKTDDAVDTIISNATRKKMAFAVRQDLIRSVLTLGSIHESEFPSQVLHTSYKKCAQCIVTTGNKLLTAFQLTDSFRMSHSVFITGMVVTEDNKLLLCSFYDRKVLVYNDNSQYVSTVTMEHQPWDIAVIPGGDQYVVTLPWIRSIQYINSKDLSLGKCFRLAMSSLTHGIAADKQYIYVGGYGIISVLNNKKNVVREITLEGDGIVYHLAVNDNNVYASGSGNQIYCIDHSDKIRQTVIGADRIRKIIIDQGGYIYVCGGGLGKVHRLDKELKQTMTIGDDSAEDIRTICFNTNCTKLFVASEDGKNIAVFSCS